MVQVTINGDQYEVEKGSLECELVAGLQGTSLAFALVPGQGYPPLGKLVSLTLAGLSFSGLLTSDGRSSANTHIGPRPYRAVGRQALLSRNVSYETRAMTNVGVILAELLFNSGITGAVIGEDRTVRGFAFAGKLSDALTYLAARGGYMLFLGPTGVELIDREDPPNSPLAWNVGSTEGWNNLQKSPTRDPIYNRVVIFGGVPKNSPDDPDQEEVEVPDVGNGVKVRYPYPKTIDEIYDVQVDGVSVTVVQKGDLAQLTADCWNDFTLSDIVFNTPPAQDAEVVLFGRIQLVRGQWDDTAHQEEVAAEFGSDGILEYSETRPDIRTQEEADEFAERLAQVICQPKNEFSAEVWGEGAIYKPGRLQLVSDSRDSYFESELVQRVRLKYNDASEKWEQSVQCANGNDGDVEGNPVFMFSSTGRGSGGGSRGNLITDKLPPTATSPANGPRLANPQNIVFNSLGDAYIADTGNGRIRKISSGILSTYAGPGDGYISGDGGPATEAGLYSVSCLAIDTEDNLYLLAPLTHRVRVINFTTGNITAFAGDGTEGGTGNGGPATDAQLQNDNAISINGNNIYISQYQYGMRYVDISSGIIDEFIPIFSGDLVQSALWDGVDVYFISGDINFGGSFVKKRDSLGTVTIVAGAIGVDGYTGDGGPATDASLNFYNGSGAQIGLALDEDGNLYIADVGNHVIRRVDTDGTISTFAGTGTGGYSGDGGAALAAQLDTPSGLGIHGGYLYICDMNNDVVRRVHLATGIITLFAGTPGANGFSGDGGPAT